MDRIRQIWGTVKTWWEANVGKVSVFGVLLLLYTIPPDWSARNQYWRTHLPAVIAFLSNHSRTVLVAVGLALIAWDHHRIVKKRGPKPHDRKTLKGRVLQLRDDLQKFMDGLGAEPSVKYRVGDDEWKRQSLLITERSDKMHHGFELRFTDRTRTIIHELGEQGRLPGFLCQAFDEPAKDDKAIKQMIEYLDVAAKELISD